MIPGFPTIGGTELVILLAIILLFFGAKRIPQLARSLGKGTQEFRKGITEAASEDEAQEEEDRKEKDEKKEPSPNATASRSGSPHEEEAEKTTHAEQKS